VSHPRCVAHNHGCVAHNHGFGSSVEQPMGILYYFILFYKM